MLSAFKTLASDSSRLLVKNRLWAYGDKKKCYLFVLSIYALLGAGD